MVQSVHDTVFADTTLYSVQSPLYYQQAEPLLFDGMHAAENLFRADWITIVLFTSLLIYAFVATYSRHIFTDIAKLLTFGASGSPEENYHGLFRWQSTLANLASFMSLSLVLYFFVIHFGTEFPFNARGPEIWFIILAAISLLVAIRHVTSAATGFLSESEDAFSEYLNSIYILYRALGLSVIPVSIAVSYVPGLPHEVLITTGIIIILLLFIFRIIRLLVIFLQSGVSIFYFILYLCALEILPGAILIKVLSS